MALRSAAAAALSFIHDVQPVSIPELQAINWKTKKSIPRFLAIILVVILTVMNYEWMPAVLFLAYLLYGVLRPWLSRDWRREIEEEIGEEPSDETVEQAR